MWGPPLIGFLAGGVFLRGADLVLPCLHPGHSVPEAEGVETSWRRSVLLVLAITLHNIPEGLAVGVAFGAVKASNRSSVRFNSRWITTLLTRWLPVNSRRRYRHESTAREHFQKKVNEKVKKSFNC